MILTSTQLLLLCVIGALPALVIVGVGWKGGVAPLKIAAEAIPALNLLMLALAVVLPLSGVPRVVLLAIGVLLGSWGVFNSVRSWRRSKAASPPSLRSAGPGPG